jgi:histidyl-tRNA synthetase
MGLDRILLAKGESDPEPALDAFVIVADGDRRLEAQTLVRSLRRSGLRVDGVAGERSVKAQFKAADRARAANALVVGEEWTEGRVTARDLATGEQQPVAVEEIETWLKR